MVAEEYARQGLVLEERFVNMENVYVSIQQVLAIHAPHGARVQTANKLEIVQIQNIDLIQVILMVLRLWYQDLV
jgi:hypothetical protein